MDGRLLAQLGWLFLREVDAIERPYDYPPKFLNREELRESKRLRAAADELFARAARAGQRDSSTDAVFGPGAITPESRR